MIDERRLATEFKDHHGVSTRRRMREHVKLSDRQIDLMARRGRVIREGRGVLVSPAAPDTPEHRAARACALTGGVVSFPTAGHLLGLRKTPPAEEVHVTVPWTRHVAPIDGIKIRRSRKLPPSHIVRRADGIHHTSAARTVFDAASWLGADELESMIEDALHRHLFTMAVLHQVTTELAHQCRDGSAHMLRVLADRADSLVPVASDYELRLDRALRARGFPSLARQVAVDLGDGLVIHPDLAVPDDGFFIEIDHPRWHGGADAIDRDHERDRRLRLLGLWVERVSDRAIDLRLQDTVEDLWRAWELARFARAKAGLMAGPPSPA